MGTTGIQSRKAFLSPLTAFFLTFAGMGRRLASPSLRNQTMPGSSLHAYRPIPTPKRPRRPYENIAQALRDDITSGDGCGRTSVVSLSREADLSWLPSRVMVPEGCPREGNPGRQWFGSPFGRPPCVRTSHKPPPAPDPLSSPPYEHPIGFRRTLGHTNIARAIRHTARHTSDLIQAVTST
jgi:hypothetical protein